MSWTTDRQCKTQDKVLCDVNMTSRLYIHLTQSDMHT